MDSADSLGMLLQMAGHEVEIAYDGEQAFRLAQARPPHAALLDIEMPKLSGDEVCRRIRREPWGRAMFLIALTGWSEDEVRGRVAEAGFDHQLVKPIEPRLLAELLEREVGPRVSPH